MLTHNIIVQGKHIAHRPPILTCPSHIERGLIGVTGRSSEPIAILPHIISFLTPPPLVVELGAGCALPITPGCNPRRTPLPGRRDRLSR